MERAKIVTWRFFPVFMGFCIASSRERSSSFASQNQHPKRLCVLSCIISLSRRWTPKSNAVCLSLELIRGHSWRLPSHCRRTPTASRGTPSGLLEQLKLRWKSCIFWALGPDHFTFIHFFLSFRAQLAAKVWLRNADQPSRLRWALWNIAEAPGVVLFSKDSPYEIAQELRSLALGAQIKIC
jgi:hypothetical protein